MSKKKNWDAVVIPPLWGVTEVAQELGVTTSNLDRVSGLPPVRVDYLKGGRLWLREEIEEFASERRRERDREASAA